MPDPAVIRSHRGHSITLTENLRFEIKGPSFEESVVLASYSEAAERIDKVIENNAIIEKKQFSAVVLDAAGKSVTLRGINRNSGDLLGIEDRYCYPNVTWIKKILQEILVARKALTELENKVKEYQIATINRGYKGMSGQELLSRLEKLEEEIKIKTEKAEMAQ